MRLANGARVEAEAIQPGKRRNTLLLFQRRHAIERQGLAACVRADGYTIVDGSCLELVEAGAQLELKMWINRISDQQATPLQQPGDASA